jgi:hypothetical protein
MPGKFVVYAWARTGSYHLTSLLDSCEDVICHGELFKPGRIELRPRLREKVLIDTPEQRDATPFKYIHQVRTLMADKHFGFKLFPSHVKRVPRLGNVLSDKTWKVIGLFRDPIETYASALRTTKTNIWTLKRGNNLPVREKLDVKVNFTEETWLPFIDKYFSFLGHLRKLSDEGGSKRIFIIRYDQLDQQPVMERLLRFVGSHAGTDKLTSEYNKQFVRPVHQAFDNWDEFSQYRAANEPMIIEPGLSVSSAPGEPVHELRHSDTKWLGWLRERLRTER